MRAWSLTALWSKERPASTNKRASRAVPHASTSCSVNSQPGQAPAISVFRRCKAAPEVLATARAQRWDPAEVVRVLLTEEITGRDAATRRMRRKTAGLPAGKTFASWREADSSIPPGTQTGLASLEWIGRAENLAIAGPSGTGKSHFVEAIADKVPACREPISRPGSSALGARPTRRQEHFPARRNSMLHASSESRSLDHSWTNDQGHIPGEPGTCP
jgi:IstB-like ATP binding protein